MRFFVAPPRLGGLLFSVRFPRKKGRAPQNDNRALEGQVAVRRIKSYSAQTGYVYQYYFEEVRSQQMRGGREGSEYVYIVSRDRKHTFPVPVFVRRDAVDRWAESHGRRLSGTEEYAVAKMCLFAAFDEIEQLEAERLTVEITPENIEELLAPLDLD